MSDEQFERFFAKVEYDPEAGCWLWTAATIEGYGVFSIKHRNHRAHRLAYEHFVGLIPSGLVPDHLCRIHRCVNPWHLEPVTQAENIRRGDGPAMAAARGAARTHCPRSHEYTPENIYRTRTGARTCRICARAARARWLERNR